MGKENELLDVIAIGAGVAGIYQIKRLSDHGFNAVLLEANEDLGGTWFKNRYPGCRFDSESYSYGYSFSRELVNEWHWKERFSAQLENLKYLNYVADKFKLRQHIRFNAQVQSMIWEETEHLWRVRLADGEELTARFIVTCLGVLSIPFTPEIEGAEAFQGRSFHTFDWPAEPLDLTDKRVGVIGTGATGIQIIAEIADKVGDLTVFQRHPNWSIPLNNAAIDRDEMDEIRSRYDEILAICEESQGGFVHLPDRRGFDAVTKEERKALWDELYDRHGFALLLANFPETFLEADANQALSNYVADRIRARVRDPEIAEKLIPKDHGFGMKRLPLETNYFEAYNRDNVRLIDISETPIQQITDRGVMAKGEHHELDVLVYATGFHTITGALNRIDIQGAQGLLLRDKWQHETSTYLGLLTHGFPNMLMVAGPQSVSGSTNYPRTIETGVDWVTNLLLRLRQSGQTRFEAPLQAERDWVETVTRAQERMPFSKVRSWFTGYAPDADAGAKRYNAFWGGGPKYRAYLRQVEEDEYRSLDIR
ncbi:MAG: NAD(P)/FAD-dependent oxidoreductase [Pseudomonadota bacterium]